MHSGHVSLQLGKIGGLFWNDVEIMDIEEISENIWNMWKCEIYRNVVRICDDILEIPLYALHSGHVSLHRGKDTWNYWNNVGIMKICENVWKYMKISGNVKFIENWLKIPLSCLHSGHVSLQLGKNRWDH